MADYARRAHVLSWRGVLSEGSATLRWSCALVAALACIMLVSTQWGYAGIQFADGSAFYVMFMLVPVVLGALLLGTRAGCGLGLFSGLVLCLHAALAPLDYYEFAYVTPWTAIVPTVVFSLVVGLLFAWILSTGVYGLRRTLLLSLVCLVSSGVFTVVFAATYVWQAHPVLGATGAGVMPFRVVLQAIVDALVLALVTVAVFALVERAGFFAHLSGLREAFGVRLLGVVVASFLVVATVAYANTTAGKLVISLDDMRSEVVYLLDQVIRVTGYDWDSQQLFTVWMGGSSDATGTNAELNPGGMLWNLIKGYTEDEDGLMIVSARNRVLGVNTDRLKMLSGDRLADCLDANMLSAIRKSVSEGTIEQVIYVAPCRFNDLFKAVVPESEEAFAGLTTPQVGYVVAVSSGDYQVALVRPAGMVFEGRNDVASWITASSLVLLLAVSALVWRLLDRMVARPMDATNGALARITEGDLDARVEEGGTYEFCDLSAGINRTVDALQGWIGEAERRMDAEMATAKAIQESALPSVFPPYPDIERFDIFASMNAAKDVGGDFYDFFLVGDDCTPEAGKLAFVVADVSGKGVPAALFMMRAKTQIRDYLESGMEVGEAVENANRRLCEGNEEEGMFVTAWVGVLDYASGHVDFVNAGHNPPLLFHDGNWDWMRKTSGMPLGILDDLPYAAHAIDCAVGDTLLLYTDGVTEAFSVDEEQYGEERLLRLVGAEAGLRPHELVDAVRSDVAAFSEGTEQSDDITMLVLEVGVAPEGRARLVVPAEVDEVGRVVDFINAELDRRLCPGRVQALLDVAVEELFVNVCSYAYEEAAPDVERVVRVTYAYSVSPSSLTVEIIDEGVPFDPLDVADERIDAQATLDDIRIGGLGILMASQSVDEMRYERVGASNVVTLVKYW